MADCIFCKIVNKEVGATVVLENDDLVAFHDLNPQAPTHLLIVPKKHVEKLSDCGPQDTELLGKIQLAAKALAEQFELVNGFRLVVNNGKGAGQAVNHLHYHLIGGRRMNWPPG
ncbi:MAG: histidine triad nucleotide-binding protein [bacterium]